MCIYEYNKVFVRKTIWRKKWERRIIKHENEPMVVPIFTGAGDPKYNRMEKKIYKLYRKRAFRSRWTLYKLLNQLKDKYTKWEVKVSTWYEEKWIFKGWETIPIEFELVCPVKILFKSADFLTLWERDQWDYDPKAPDHFQSWAIWDDDEREYQEEDFEDTSETIEEETIEA